ncbi:MAG TPA: transcriptional regulator [Anaerolineales bacterium]|nr:transcriptional regulator [Anaerolineae bacterium]HIQ01604.1 transcriptional regulator [Anaerolineales bacterium]
MMEIRDPEVKADLLRRLRRIEGQARGVARMIEEGRDCQEVLQQLSAIRAAAHQVSLRLMRSFAVECIQSSEGSPEEAVEALIQVLSRVS